MSSQHHPLLFTFPPVLILTRSGFIAVISHTGHDLCGSIKVQSSATKLKDVKLSLKKTEFITCIVRPV